MNENQYQYLLKIAEKQSITLAARELYISQPALSNLVHSVEKQYGTKIFVTENGRLKLSYSGQLIMDALRQQKDIEDRLRRSLQDVAEERTGQIRIGISSGRAPMFLSHVLPEFRNRYPGIQLLIDTHSAAGFENLVSNSVLDFAFVMNRASVPSKVRERLVYEPILDYYCLLAAPPSHPLVREAQAEPDWRKRRAVDLNEFRGIPFITTVREERHKAWLESILEPYHFQPSYTIVLSEEASVFDLVQADLGFTLVQDYIAFSRQTGSFFRLDRDRSKATLNAIYRRDFQLTEAMRFFIDLLHAHTADGSLLEFRGSRG